MGDKHGKALKSLVLAAGLLVERAERAPLEVASLLGRPLLLGLGEQG